MVQNMEPTIHLPFQPIKLKHYRHSKFTRQKLMEPSQKIF